MKHVTFIVLGFLLVPVFLWGAAPQTSEEEILKTLALKIHHGYTATAYHEVTVDSLFRPSKGKKPVLRIGHREIWYASPEKIRIEKKVDALPPWVVVRRGNEMFFRRKGGWRARPVPPGANLAEKGSFLNIRGKPYLALLVQNYTVHLRHARSFLGNPVDILTIEPRYLRRFAWEFWVDSKTGLILRRVQELVERKGRHPVFASVVREIDFPKQFPDSLFVVPEDKIVKISLDQKKFHPEQKGGHEFHNARAYLHNVPFPVYWPKPLPSGFAFIKGNWARHHGGQMAHTHFSDGLLDFSVFQIQTSQKMQKRMARRFHRSPHAQEPNMRVQTVVAEKDGFTFFIVGNMPKPWLRKIAKALAPLESDSQKSAK